MTTFEKLREANVARAGGAFAPINSWSPTDWACAMAGEVGEACNFVKKLRRLENPDSVFTKSMNNTDADHIRAEIGKELGDALIYMDLLAIRLGLVLGDEVQKKFNEVSERVGSTVRL